MHNEIECSCGTFTHLSAGDFFEIFVGLASLPSSFDWFIEEAEAPELSAALADYLCKGRSWRMWEPQLPLWDI